jgi:hypothetical protein
VVQPATALRSSSHKGGGGAIMSEEIHRFVAGEKITVTTTLVHAQATFCVTERCS